MQSLLKKGFCGTVLLILLAGLPQAGYGADEISFGAIGDYGDDNADEAAVATLVNDLNPDFIITTGDNSYDATDIDDNIGKYYSDYIGDYTGSYGSGSATNRFFPSLGNHDLSDGGGFVAYVAYFTLPGNERYYEFVSGPVHFFALHSNAAEQDGITFDSTQGNWLQAGLAASTAPFKVVFFHHPPYSSSAVHGSQTVMQWPFEDWGATAVLNGHDHTYERILRDDNSDGTLMPYFVTGLGGRPIYPFDTSFVEGSEARYNEDFGTMLITASDKSITFEFYSVAGGGTLIDSYTITRAICGDGILDTGEDCDDGDESADCNADCTTAECGDGILNSTAGEECEDGNTTDGDGCNSICLNESDYRIGGSGCTLINNDMPANSSAPVILMLAAVLLGLGCRRCFH